MKIRLKSLKMTLDGLTLTFSKELIRYLILRHCQMRFDLGVNGMVKALFENGKIRIMRDGTQTKSYLYISDCIDAILLATEKSKKQVEIYNVGSEDQIDVKTMAQIIIEEMGLRNVKFRFTGGVNGGRGWEGDVKNMLLDISKLKTLEWKPKYNSQQE